MSGGRASTSREDSRSADPGDPAPSRSAAVRGAAAYVKRLTDGIDKAGDHRRGSATPPEWPAGKAARSDEPDYFTSG
jgi:hypothetical protein